MRKILKTLTLTIMISVMSSMVVFANYIQAQEIQQRLLELGVPTTYVGNIVEYLQKTEISDEHFQAIKAKLNEAEKILNGEKDITIIDDERKGILQNLAIESAQILGLRVVFGEDSKGVTTVTILDSNNNHIASLKTEHVIEVIQNFDLEGIKGIVEEILEFTKETGGDKFEPIGGEEFNNTGANVGNKIALGLGLITLSVLTFVKTKKVFA